MGSAGQVILFVCTLALLAIVGSLVFAYSSRIFFSVIQGSAAGNDEVIWGDEPIIDWLFQGGYLLFLLCVPLVPVGITLRAISPDFFTEQPVVTAVVMGIVIWLLFPICALSSMSADSKWVVFRVKVLPVLGKYASATVQFYTVSFSLLVLGMGPWLIILGGGPLLLSILAALGSGAAWLIYARLLGRLGWIISGIPTKRKPRQRKINRPQPVDETDSPPSSPAKAKEESSPHREKAYLPSPPRAETSSVETAESYLLQEVEEESSPLPPPLPLDADEELPLLPVGEDLRRDEQAQESSTDESDDLQLIPVEERAPSLPPDMIEEDESPYDMSEAPPPPRPADLPLDGYDPIESTRPEDEVDPEKLEPHERIVKRPKAPKRAPKTLLPGVLNFPFYEQSIPVWLTISLGQFGVGLILRGLIALGP